MVTIGKHPLDIGIEVHAGEPVDFSVNVLDAAGGGQPLSLWTGLAQIRASMSPTAALLYTFTLTLETGSVRVTAPSVDTAGWTFGSAPWDLVLIAPDQTRTVHAAGWVRCYPTVSR